MLGSKINDHLGVGLGERVDADVQRIDVVLPHVLKCRRDVWLATDVEQFDGDSQRLPRRFDCLPLRWRYRVSHIVHEAHPRNHGECLFQQLDSLAREFRREST